MRYVRMIIASWKKREQEPFGSFGGNQITLFYCTSLKIFKVQSYSWPGDKRSEIQPHLQLQMTPARPRLDAHVSVELSKVLQETSLISQCDSFPRGVRNYSRGWRHLSWEDTADMNSLVFETFEVSRDVWTVRWESTSQGAAEGELMFAACWNSTCCSMKSCNNANGDTSCSQAIACANPMPHLSFHSTFPQGTSVPDFYICRHAHKLNRECRHSSGWLLPCKLPQ